MQMKNIDITKLSREELENLFNELKVDYNNIKVDYNNILDKNKKQEDKLNKVTKKLEKAETEYKIVEAKYRKVLKELESLKEKYEKELELVKLQNINKYVKTSEKTDENIVNEVEEKIDKGPKKRKPRTKQKEHFIHELEKIVNEERIIDYDFEGNNVDRTKVKKIGEDRTIKIEAQELPIKVVEVIRPKYADKERIYQALSEDVFPNSVLTPSFAASIVCFKYQLSIPLYRYSEMLKSFGINISESNLCNYVKRVSEKLDRLYEELKKELLNNVVIHIDETTLVVLDEKEKDKCYMFVYRSGHWTDKQVCLYEFNESRKTDKTAKLLNEYKGYVVCDGYTGYDFLEEKGIKIQRCWVHIRRYFYDAIKVLSEKERKKSPAYKVFKLINEMFKYEAEMVKETRTAEEIKEIRNSEKYQKILDDIDNEVTMLSEKITKDGLILKAVNYYINIKKKGELYTFKENGYIEIDNNLAERTVKPFVIGRKNFMFCKTSSGAEVTSKMYSIVQTAINNGINAERYISYVLENIDKTNNLESLLPWNEEIKNKFGIIK